MGRFTKTPYLVLFIMLGAIGIVTASAQDTGGGVDHPGTWYVGEGLKTGDLFSYNLCHINYKDCTEFQIDWWIGDEITVGVEQKWLAQVVIFDGIKIIKGNMVLDKIAPEPTSSSSHLVPYANAYKVSIVWLSAFANADEPKAFSAASWGKSGAIGGSQIIPTALETISVPAGTYDTIRIQWNTGGLESKVWVVDNFPFPVKALAYAWVTTGVAPVMYEFLLLDFKENVNSDPFSNITPTEPPPICPAIYDPVCGVDGVTYGNSCEADAAQVGILHEGECREPESTIGEVQWLEESYPATGAGVVQVFDPDMNLNPQAIDNFDVHVWSDTDAGGIALTVSETGASSGTYQGTVFFTLTEESSGHRLKVSEGDTIFAEYRDSTLPPPFLPTDQLDILGTAVIDGTVCDPCPPPVPPLQEQIDALNLALETVQDALAIQITGAFTSIDALIQGIGTLLSVMGTINDGVVAAFQLIATEIGDRITGDATLQTQVDDLKERVAALENPPPPPPPPPPSPILTVFVDDQDVTTFSGAQIIKVVVNNPDLKDTDESETEPDVMVNNLKLRMVQEVDGNWYGYFSDRDSALIVDSQVITPGTGLDFGVFCSRDSGFVLGPTIIVADTEGFAIQDPALVTDEVNGNANATPLTNLCIDPIPNATPNDLMNVLDAGTMTPAGLPLQGQIGIRDGFWPFIQLYPFNVNDDVMIQYAIGGIPPIVKTLTFVESSKESHVSIPAGSSVPGCEETNECWVPAEVIVDVGGEVTWSNDDTAAHTVTSGTPSDSDSVGKLFDSGLLLAGGTFSHIFEEAGTVDYFCIVHPWQQGVVIVI